MDSLWFTIVLLEIYFLNLKGLVPLNLKHFSVLVHFIVAWSVNVAAAINYVSHNGNHTGSVAPQATTVVVAYCGIPLPINAGLWLASKTGTQLVAARNKTLPLQ
jgi:hypothetical protein